VRSFVTVEFLELKAVRLGVESDQAQQFGGVSPAIAPFQLEHQVDYIADISTNDLIGKLDAGLQHAAREPGNRLARGIGMDGRKAAGMAGVPGLEQIESFAAADFAQDDAIGPVTESRPEQVPDSHGRYAGLFAAGLKANQVGLD
jgi:hypothetical protein